MGPVAALMLLVGCNADMTLCREVPVPTPIFGSQKGCEQALPLALRMAGTGDAKLLGSCTPVARDALARADHVEWAVNRAGSLSVSLADQTAVVASR